MIEIDEKEYYSNCCEAPPLYEIDEFPGETLGICMSCKEGAIFKIIRENK